MILALHENKIDILAINETKINENKMKPTACAIG